MSNDSGILYVVATPIGNRSDLSDRARELLGSVDLIAAEDTRHTGRLLQYLGIDQPMLSLHEHNERARVPGLISRLGQGESIALVADAGTPLISDPGYRLVCAARDAGVTVSPVPGPCAAVAALSVAGLPTNRFAFEGFLPARAAARRQRLQGLRKEPRTLILYESIGRLEALLTDLADAFGPDRGATVAREMTKLHEQIVCGSLSELRSWCGRGDLPRRGEVVVIVAGSPDDPTDRAASIAPDDLLAVLLKELPPGRAAAVVARLTGQSRDEVYRAALAMGSDRPES